jgi:hypothetical protein
MKRTETIGRKSIHLAAWLHPPACLAVAAITLMVGTTDDQDMMVDNPNAL